MSIDEEDLPIIIDDVDPDDEEDEQIEKMLKRVGIKQEASMYIGGKKIW